jgi:hypothetical protein
MLRASAGTEAPRRAGCTSRDPLLGPESIATRDHAVLGCGSSGHPRILSTQRHVTVSGKVNKVIDHGVLEEPTFFRPKAAMAARSLVGYRQIGCIKTLKEGFCDQIRMQGAVLRADNS